LDLSLSEVSKEVKLAQAEEKTCIQGTYLSSNGDNSNVAAVDVKDGNIN
jgi:hypothetical protein